MRFTKIELLEKLRQMEATLEIVEEKYVERIKELEAKNEKLKENQRWRKYPEEKPSVDTRYIICGSSGFRDADRWMYLKEKQRMGFGFHDYGVKYWMPMPEAPKEL